MKVFIKNKTNFLTIILVLNMSCLIFKDSTGVIQAQYSHTDIFLTSYWYLEEGEINDMPFPEIGMTFTRVDFSDFFQINYYLNLCEEIIIVPFTEITDDSFTLLSIDEHQSCNFTDPEDISALDLAMSLFFETPMDENGTPKNPFSYSIIETSYDDYELLITNTDGDWALFQRDQLTNVGDFAKDSFTLYPNPVKETLFISSTINQAVNASIYNLNGKLLQSHSIENKTTALDVKSLDQGLYFIVFETETGERVSKKFVKR